MFGKHRSRIWRRTKRLLPQQRMSWVLSATVLCFSDLFKYLQHATKVKDHLLLFIWSKFCNPLSVKAAKISCPLRFWAKQSFSTYGSQEGPTKKSESRFQIGREPLLQSTPKPLTRLRFTFQQEKQCQVQFVFLYVVVNLMRGCAKALKKHFFCLPLSSQYPPPLCKFCTSFKWSTFLQ